MQKRGQVTVFVIVALLVLGLSALIFVLNERITPEIKPVDTAPVQQFVESCLQKTLSEGISFIAENGGYNHLPELSSSDAFHNAPYYVYLGEDTSPTLQSIQRQLADYITSQLPFCIQQFKAFPYTISFSEISTRVSILLGMVDADISFPITIEQGEQQATLDTFRVSQPSSLFEMYSASQEIVDYTLLFDNAICFDCIDDTAQKNNLQISVLEFKLDELFYIIEDLDKELVYRFASKHQDLPESDIVNYNFIPGEIPWE
ncbi:hypothetical protein COV20_01350 [Candidatus Woesearchaeota archaeon CG10_big_fil_rev_8_21_14_0_10_45_16]|nr:MAG: hypothetical protein COV20_01350 [Candidatus Woesearchaeota archaeon CG10_big_fil_rev_8_21_14_0_10_45_16]